LGVVEADPGEAVVPVLAELAAVLAEAQEEVAREAQEEARGVRVQVEVPVAAADLEVEVQAAVEVEEVRGGPAGEVVAQAGRAGADR